MVTKKFNRKEFDFVAYSFTFDFCTLKEKARLMRALFDAWRWGTRINEQTNGRKANV